MKMNDDKEYAARLKAREIYADGSDDDIEVDDNAEVHDVVEGYWVQAWVYVPNELIK